MNDARLARLHAIVATVPLAAWAVFHVWEQWAAFRGRLAWLVRMHSTSSGPAVAAELLVGVAPLLARAALHVGALVRRERLPGMAREGDTALGVGLGFLAPWASSVAILFLLWHVAWLWGAKVMGADSVELYDAMQRTLGLPWALVLHAVGLGAIAWHLAAALPDGLEAVGLVTGPESRSSARTVTLAIGLCLFVLTAQLVGWLGTGTGTFWPIQVVGQ
ncbi:MAG: hypothetical protein K1X94_01905 [Sandaracinaceae bacterium]|nr:hypothetical protein [Sandaracinaceae bacterium]